MKLAAALAIALVTGCGSAPATHRYALDPPSIVPVKPVDEKAPVLALEELEVDAAYDDERIAYRPDRYRFEYYDYHLWSAPPSLAVSDYLRASFARSAHFGRVSRSVDSDADVVLRGRITAIEEVDVSPTKWRGRIALELQLEDAKSGVLLWSQAFAEELPLEHQSPEGLAHAIHRALARITAKALPAIAKHARAAKVRHDSTPAGPGGPPVTLAD